MPTLEIVTCTNEGHKVMCMIEATRAVARALYGPAERNGRKVSIHAEITDPCTCHLDALIWMTTQAMLSGHVEDSLIANIFDLGILYARIGIIR